MLVLWLNAMMANGKITINKGGLSSRDLGGQGEMSYPILGRFWRFNGAAVDCYDMINEQLVYNLSLNDGNYRLGSNYGYHYDERMDDPLLQLLMEMDVPTRVLTGDGDSYKVVISSLCPCSGRNTIKIERHETNGMSLMELRSELSTLEWKTADAGFISALKDVEVARRWVAEHMHSQIKVSRGGYYGNDRFYFNRREIDLDALLGYRRCLAWGREQDDYMAVPLSHLLSVHGEEIFDLIPS